VPGDHGTAPARIYDRVVPTYDLDSGPMEWVGHVADAACLLAPPGRFWRQVSAPD
jgi:hypothetical protein